MKNNFDKTQKAELNSWFSSDPKVNHDKRIREVIRYPLLKKQMGLDYLDTSEMHVFDIGCGPFGGVSTIINAKIVTRIDPLINEYKKYYPIHNGLSKKAEDLQDDLRLADLIIITNALDHFDRPYEFLTHLRTFMKPGAFFAHLHAENNNYSHPHEAHPHGVNPEMFNEVLYDNFELVWNLQNITYGWKKQKAFSGLYRKTTGY